MSETPASAEVLALARRIAANVKVGVAPSEILAGHWDKSPLVQCALAAILECSEMAANYCDADGNHGLGDALRSQEHLRSPST